MKKAPHPSLLHELRAWSEGFARLAGVDEAGRGPLAGPVIAAAVRMDRAPLECESERLFKGLTDSKCLSETRRDHFFQVLTTHSGVQFGVGRVDVAEIDRLNILRATHLAMFRAASALEGGVDCLLVDGLPVPGLPAEARFIVGGDRESLLIAAASVIAKVSRDRIMMEIDRDYPAYGFARHKGYGTQEHLKALDRFGVTPQHRRSFRPVYEKQLDFG